MPERASMENSLQDIGKASARLSCPSLSPFLPRQNHHSMLLAKAKDKTCLKTSRKQISRAVNKSYPGKTEHFTTKKKKNHCREMPPKSNNKLELTLESIHDYEELHCLIDIFDFCFMNWHISFQGISE